MNWKIQYTKQSQNDLKSIYEYIAFSLLAPEAARKQTDRIMKEICDLEFMPEKFRVYEDEPWKSQGLRYFPVNHYIILYLPKRETETITIIRIIYGGRDIQRQLEETVLP